MTKGEILSGGLFQRKVLQKALDGLMGHWQVQVSANSDGTFNLHDENLQVIAVLDKTTTIKEILESEQNKKNKFVG